MFRFCNYTTYILLLFISLFLIGCDSVLQGYGQPEGETVAFATLAPPFATPTVIFNLTPSPSETPTSPPVPTIFSASVSISASASTLSASPISPPSPLAASPQPTLPPTPVPQWYRIQAGDSLSSIASANQVSLEELLKVNPSLPQHEIEVGSVIGVPTEILVNLPNSYLLHDSEVVYSPAYLTWDTDAFLKQQGGFLADYREEEQSAAQIIDTIAAQYHVGPRALLGILELISGWVTNKEPSNIENPLGLPNLGSSKLTSQVKWVAQKLMQGYYGQLEGRRDWVILSNGVTARLSPGTNPGSAAVGNVLAALVRPAEAFPVVLQEEHFQKTYRRLFGELAGGHILPPHQEQPYFALPWKEGQPWVFTGGPHGGYVDDYSGWAALDFAPPVKSGCQPSTYPVYSVAPGLVIGSQYGETWIDMDQDGDLRTGWVIFYMHLATAGRVQKGTIVQTGDVLGFPSCEGGVVTGTHVHMARMYHGQWMPAHGPVPFQLGDWKAQAIVGSSYDGYLINSAGQILEACDCRDISKNIFPSDP